MLVPPVLQGVEVHTCFADVSGLACCHIVSVPLRLKSDDLSWSDGSVVCEQACLFVYQLPHALLGGLSNVWAHAGLVVKCIDKVTQGCHVRALVCAVWMGCSSLGIGLAKIKVPEGVLEGELIHSVGGQEEPVYRCDEFILLEGTFRHSERGSDVLSSWHLGGVGQECGGIDRLDAEIISGLPVFEENLTVVPWVLVYHGVLIGPELMDFQIVASLLLDCILVPSYESSNVGLVVEVAPMPADSTVFAAKVGVPSVHGEDLLRIRADDWLLLLLGTLVSADIDVIVGAKFRLGVKDAHEPSVEEPVLDIEVLGDCFPLVPGHDSVVCRGGVRLGSGRRSESFPDVLDSEVLVVLIVQAFDFDGDS